MKVILLFFLLSIFPLFSRNIGPVVQGEKRPSTDDPSYKPAIIPFFLQRKTELTPAEQFLLDPGISPEQLLDRLEKKEEHTISREEEFLLDNFYKDPLAQKIYYQKYFLPQLGQNYVPVPQPPEYFQETIWERRITIFLLSLPVTLAVSYGALRGYKETRNLPKPLSRNETAGVFFTGILASIFITYYDEKYHKSLEEYARELKKKK